MFNLRLNPFASIHPTDNVDSTKQPSAQAPGGHSHTRTHLPRADSFYGKHMKQFLHRRLNETSDQKPMKPLTWQQKFQQNTFFQPMGRYLSRSPLQMTKSTLSRLANPLWIPARTPAAQQPGRKPMYPIPSAALASNRPVQPSPLRQQTTVLPKFNTVSGLPPATAEEKKTIQGLYQQFFKECQEYEGYDEQSAIAMTAARLKKSNPEFADHRLADVKKFVRESLGMAGRRPPTSASAGTQQPQAYAAPKTRISDMTGSQVPSAPPAKLWPPATSVLSQFLGKWQNTPFTSPSAEIEIPLEYNAKSALGLVNKEGAAAQIEFFTERVHIPIPSDTQFSGERQYALYANAMVLAHLHERREKGYTVGISDFHWHRMPASPEHAKHAAAARQLADLVLQAGDKDMDKIEAQLKALNKGLGWDDTKDVDEQISRASWRAMCAQNEAMREELMQTNNSALLSHPALPHVRAELHDEKIRAEEATQRRQDRKSVEGHIKEKLSLWTKDAQAAHSGNAAAAKKSIHEKIRSACDQLLPDARWSATRKELAAKRLMRNFDEASVQQQISQDISRWMTEALAAHPGNSQAAKKAVHEKISGACAQLTGEHWGRSAAPASEAADEDDEVDTSRADAATERIIDRFEETIAARMGDR